MGQRFPFSSVFGGAGSSPSASRDANGKYSRAGLVPNTSAALYDLTAGGPAVETVTVDGTGKASFTATPVAGHTYVVDGVTRASGGTVPAGTAPPPQTFSGVVANRGAGASRSTVTPAAGVLTGNQETQHTLTAPARYLELVYDNITTDGGAGIISTGLPDKTIRAGVRLRVQTGVAAQTIIPAYAEALHDGVPGVTRDITITSGGFKSLFVDLGQEYPAGLSMLVTAFTTWPTTPARYSQTDTIAAAFNEVNEFGPALPDKTLSADSTGSNPWNAVGRVTPYSTNVPRLIRGLKLAAVPKSFGIGGDSITVAGSGDSASTTVGQGHIGYMQRACGNTYGWFTDGATGLSLAFVRSNAARLAATITWLQGRGVTHFICAWGPNDIASNRAVNAFLADVMWLKGVLQSYGIQMLVVTLMPRPSGTTGANYNASQSTNDLDAGYAAANGGKPAWQAVNEINTAYRTGAYGTVIDAHLTVADPNDPTKWRTDLATQPSGDLIHPNSFFHGRLANDTAPVLAAA